MKKSLLALAALTAFAGAASAQSSVTLFGVVDVNARAVENGNSGTLKSLSTDGMSSSRSASRHQDWWGLRAASAEARLGPSRDDGRKHGFTPTSTSQHVRCWVASVKSASAVTTA